MGESERVNEIFSHCFVKSDRTVHLCMTSDSSCIGSGARKCAVVAIKSCQVSMSGAVPQARQPVTWSCVPGLKPELFMATVHMQFVLEFMMLLVQPVEKLKIFEWTKSRVWFVGL